MRQKCKLFEMLQIKHVFAKLRVYDLKVTNVQKVGDI